MPAPSIAALLDYETNYEDALATYLDAQLTGVQVLTPRTLITAAEGGELTTPRVTVQMMLGGTYPNQEQQRTTDGAWYDSMKFGTLTLTSVIQRNGSGQSLTTLRGGIRKAMLAATAALNGTTLPYYQTLLVREGACQMSVGDTNDELIYAQSYELQFAIKTDQWAAT